MHTIALENSDHGTMLGCARITNLHPMKFRTLTLGAFILLAGSSTTAQTIITIAGTGTAGFLGDNGPATAARVNLPTTVQRDAFGNLYIADRMNHRVRRIDQDGIITTIAGTGTAGFSGDGGPATAAQLNQPIGLAVADNGILYITDHGNRRIRRLAPDGTITTIAGTGVAGGAGDGGPALQAQFNNPWAVLLRGTELYIADRSNDRVRMIDLNTGIITSVAGTGTAGSSGDGGPATAAQLNKPIALCFDAQDRLYIADENNERVRRVDLNTGIITTVAGNGQTGFQGDGGQATAARLNKPCGVATDLEGNLYISDRMNQRLRRVGTNGVISTIAGTGTVGFNGDGGPATSAQINYPRELFSDGSGNIYFADTDNNRIRKITYCLLPTVPVAASSAIATVCPGDEVTLSITAGQLNAATDWQWYANGCGQVPVGSGTSITVTPQQTTTYFVRGEGDCVTPYACATITVNVLEEVSFTGFPQFFCVTAAPIVLAGGDPEGGIYTGPGVSDGIFDPAEAGLGTHTITYAYGDLLGCILTAVHEVTVDFCTGITERQANNAILVHPNPVRDVLFVNATSLVPHAELLDATGRITKAWSPVAERFELSMAGLPSGMYFLRTHGLQGGQTSVRVVVY